MSHARARQAIELMLAGWADARPIRIAYGPQPFEPTAGEMYLRTFLMPASTTCRYLGGEAYEYRGIYQLSVVSPAGQPLALAESLLAELAEVFPLDRRLSRSGFEGVIIEPLDLGPIIISGDTYTLPASFTYQGEADR
ncbi:phage tail terminator-like protein [Metapseudomonas otitidis]|uniref:phage tail terminator-like protein n=1 Tax=Metapseudomonas otitidis TaxID=319939 RepID=UPI0039FCFB49